MFQGRGRGHIQLDDLKIAALREENRGVVLKVGTEIATQASVDRERVMLQTIQNGLGQFPRLGGTREFVVSDRLRPEQKHAVQVILDSHDLAVNLRGAAGTGKTATLQEIQRGLAEGGHQIVAVAPTRSAVEELGKVGFSHALTIEHLLQDPRERLGLRGKVLIVDEAGMVSSRQMSDLLQLAERSQARILFSGDTQQIQSVEAGDALRVLEQGTQLRSVSLRQVQRQTLAEYRNAVEELRKDPARGFQQLERMGAVREVDWQLRPQEVSQAYWTQAQKQQTKHYQPGMMLAFHKATKDVGKHESVEVVKVEKDKLTARKESGREITLTRRQAQAFSVHEQREMEVSAGDKLLLEANRRDTKFRVTNGELVTVARVDRGRIELEDGRTLPANYRTFDHGYVVTAHRSQGKTVDAVIVSGDRMSKELFYVAATRGRESLTVITSDKEQLRETIGISGERTSASELARKAGQQDSPGHHRLPELQLGQSIESARDFALWQSASLAAQERQRGPQPQIEPTLQRQQEEKQKRELDHGHGIGF